MAQVETLGTVLRRPATGPAMERAFQRIIQVRRTENEVDANEWRAHPCFPAEHRSP